MGIYTSWKCIYGKVYKEWEVIKLRKTKVAKLR